MLVKGATGDVDICQSVGGHINAGNGLSSCRDQNNPWGNADAKMDASKHNQQNVSELNMNESNWY